MKKLIAVGFASGLLLWAGAVHAATVISAGSNLGNYVTTLENKVDSSVDSNQPLADGSGSAITDPSYFSGLTPISFTLSDDTGSTTNVRILAPGLDTSKFQMWAYSPADSKWYDINALGFGDPSGIPLDQALLVSPVDLYVLGTEAGTYPANFVLWDVDNSVSVAQTSVDVNIPDTIPPVIDSQSDVTAEATSGSGATVSFTVNSTDNVDGVQPASCSPSSGSTFALGTTTVTCDKTDLAGNAATSMNFNVVVQDTTGPSITLNGAATLSVTYGSVFSDPGAVASDMVDGSVAVNATSTVDTSVVGSYQVTYDAVDTSGNNAAQVIRNVDVVKANQVITFSSLSNATYGDADFLVSATSDSSLSVSFSASGNCSVSGNTVHLTAAGSCTITAEQAGDSSYNAASDVAHSFTVNPKSLSASATASDKVYDGNTNASGQVSLSGIVGSDDVSASGSAAFADANAGAGKTVNITGITLSGTTAGNYTLSNTSTTATAAITPASVSVSANSQTKVYGAADPSLSYIAGSLISGNSFSGSLSRTAGENVGSYAINQDTLSAGSNYTVAYTGANLSVTKADATFDLNGYNNTYDGLAHGADGTAKGVNNEDLSSLLHVASTTYTDVPGGNVNWVFDGNTNYNADSGSISVIVSPRPISVTADNKAKAFGASDPVLTYSGTLLNSDTFSGGLSRNAGEALGTYAITQGSLAASANYNVNFTPGTLTITDQDTPVITLNGNSSMRVVYGSEFTDPGATATDAHDGSLSVTVGGDVVNTSNPDLYVLTYNAVDSSNNHATQLTRTVVVESPAVVSRSRSGGVSSAPAGEVLGAFTGPTEPVDSAQVIAIKAQIVTLLNQLLAMLQSQLAAAIKAGLQ